MRGIQRLAVVIATLWPASAATPGARTAAAGVPVLAACVPRPPLSATPRPRLRRGVSAHARSLPREPEAGDRPVGLRRKRRDQAARSWVVHWSLKRSTLT